MKAMQKKEERTHTQIQANGMDFNELVRFSTPFMVQKLLSSLSTFRLPYLTLALTAWDNHRIKNVSKKKKTLWIRKKYQAKSQHSKLTFCMFLSKNAWPK